MIIRKPTKSEYNDLLEKANRMMLDVSNAEANQFIAAFEDSELVGFGRVVKKGSINEVCTLGVVRSYRNKGIGKKIIQELMSSFGSLYVVTIKPEHFKKLGFLPITEIPKEIRNKLNNHALWKGFGLPVAMNWKSE